MKRKKVIPKEKYFTIGVTRRKKIFFCDIDADNIDVYRTLHGFHIVSELSHAFDYRFDRLRVAPKYDGKGKISSPAPKLIMCACPGHRHRDKRFFGKLELYATNSN